MQQGMFPWIEANQGLLSLLALVAALALAVFEFVRAENATRGILKREVDAAVWPLNRLMDRYLGWGRSDSDDSRDAADSAPTIRLQSKHEVLRTCELLQAVSTRTFVPELAVKLKEVETRLRNECPLTADTVAQLNRQAIDERIKMIAMRTWLEDIYKPGRQKRFTK